MLALLTTALRNYLSLRRINVLTTVFVYLLTVTVTVLYAAY